MKIYFRLEQDEDGYPPDPWESLWAEKTEGGLYRLDNIPFFVKGVAPGDLVRVEEVEGMKVFTGVAVPAPSSVFRVYVHDESKVKNSRETFRSLGLPSELSHIPNLFAIEIPGNAKINPVLDLLMKGKAAGTWDFQEGVLRHRLVYS